MIYLDYLILIAIVLFAMLKGGRTERIGGLWLFINAALHAGLMMGGSGSATLHLIADGVFALGLMPLAFIFMSWWVGVMALVACAGFSVQAMYLVTDRPVDRLFVDLSNAFCWANLLTLFLATAAAIRHRHPRRSPSAVAPAATLAA